MTRDEMLSLMREPDRWPLLLMLPLARRRRRPRLGFIVAAEPAPPRVYVGNVGDVRLVRAGTSILIDASSLAECSSIAYPSHEAILDAGWVID